MSCFGTSLVAIPVLVTCCRSRGRPADELLGLVQLVLGVRAANIVCDEVALACTNPLACSPGLRLSLPTDFQQSFWRSS